MSTNPDVYGYPRRLELALKQLENNKTIVAKNRQAISRFYEESVAQGLSTPRLIRLIQILSKLSIMLGKNFESANRDDIVQVVANIEREKYSDWTKQSYKVGLKKFYKWLRRTESDYPPEVRWIKATAKKNNNLLPEELLTEEEVRKLAEAADNPRDRALVLVLYETGCRAGEILSLRVKHISVDEHGATLIVMGKTGMRRVRIIASQPALAEWLNNHPLKDNPDAPLWLVIGTKNKNEALTYEAFRMALQRLAERIELKKRIHAHLFRHSRASHLATNLTEAQMDHYLGWMPGSKMPAVYVHLSGRDVDKTLLKMHGMEVEEKQQEAKLKVRFCARCKERNSPVSRFCSRCGSPLDMQTALQVQEERTKADELMTKLLSDPDVQSVIKRKLQQMDIKLEAIS